jgi:HD-GYP domain-containing protein (c-di-GMP phosphodiesterase class II)
VTEYRALLIEFFKNHAASPCDLFVRLSDHKYVKVINEGDEIGNESISHYREKSITHFFLSDKDYHEFARDMMSVEASEAKAGSEVLTLLCGNVGIDERQSKEMLEVMDDIETVLSESSTVTSLLGRKEIWTGPFHFTHSFLTGAVGCLMAQKLSWYTPKIKEKIFLAAVLHDVLFKDERDENSEWQNFENDDVLEVHALQAGTLLAKDPHLPADVLDMIGKHHNFGNRHTKLTALFCVAHQFVLEMYRSQFEDSRKLFAVNLVSKKCTHTQFEESLQVLDSLMTVTV